MFCTAPPVSNLICTSYEKRGYGAGGSWESDQGQALVYLRAKIPNKFL